MQASRPFDQTRNAHLQDTEVAALYIEEALASGDIDAFKLALKHVAQARSGGVAELAEKSKLSREQLYRTLSPKGNPRLDTLYKVLKALDLRISILPQTQ